MKIQIYQKAGLAKSVKGKVVHLLENGTFTLLGSILFWAHFGQVLTIYNFFLDFSSKPFQIVVSFKIKLLSRSKV